MQGSVITLEILKEVFSDVPHTFEIEESMVSFASPRLTHTLRRQLLVLQTGGRRLVINKKN